MEKQENIVYGLYSTRDNTIRYVGQTTQSMWARFSEHLREAAENVSNGKAQWMRKELNSGYQINYVIMLEDCRRSVAERRMLDVYELSGHHLTNTHGTERHMDAQRKGIDRAKTEGKYKGRPASIDPTPIYELRALGVGPTEIARRLKIGRASVYRALEKIDGIEEQIQSAAG